MKLTTAFLFLLIFGTLGSSGQSTVNYLRTSEYNRLHISIKEFKNIVASIQYYYDETPTDSADQYQIITFKCDFSKDGKALSLSSFKQVTNLNLDEESYNDIILIYSWNNKPISEVTILLNNSFRKISVSGTDERKVEALFRDIDSQIKVAETTWSWINWALVFSIAGTLLYVFLFPVLVSAGIDFFTKKKNRKITLLFFASATYCLAAAVFFFSQLSFRDLFPGFILSPNKTTWFDKNANMIGFLSLIVTVVPAVYKITRWVWFKHIAQIDKDNNEKKSV